jgi:rhodanese-related sulfurtransferase
MMKLMLEKILFRKRSTIVVIFFLIIFGVSFSMFQQHSKATRGIPPKQAYDMIEKETDVVVLDVRTPGEYQSNTGHLWFYEHAQKREALLVPVQELRQRIKELEPYKGKKIIAYCRSGNRSGVAAQMLQTAGYEALNLEGGMIQWHKEGLPVSREDSK